MRRYLFNTIFLLLISNSTTVRANGFETDVELRKNYTKEYPSDNLTVLELSNRYGKIEVITWDRSFVKIDANVIVKASSKGKAQDKLDEISVNIQKTGNNIVAVTEIDSKNSSWWSGWWSGENNIKIEINYLVYMPAAIHSIIENKYGNIYLPDLKGKTSINLKYGNMEAKNITNDLLLDLSYGKATVGSVENLSGNISYSDYRGTKAKVVLITSKYSKVYLDNAISVTSSSKYDTYKLGVINNLIITGAYDDVEIESLEKGTLNFKYSGVELGSLSNGLTLDISYGSLMVENLKTSFKSMLINTSYAPIKIYGTVPTKVEIEGKYCDTNLGSDFIQKYKNNEDNSVHIKGYKISEKTSATINIKSKYGDIILK
ncbi:MAG: hypothetical protein IPO92_14640 [Saprospiraceae bacterium]|nr:hypothetical protein [Saprospiraceae bacterium]